MDKVIKVAILVAVVASSARAEEVENPIYASWAKLKPGTVVVVREVSELEADGSGRIVTTKHHKLLSVDPKKALVELVIEEGEGAKATRSEPQELTYKSTFPLPAGVDKSRIGRPVKFKAEGKEDVEAAGRTFRSEWYDTQGTTEAGPSDIRTWYSNDAPGLMVKCVIRVPKIKTITTMSLVEIKTP